MIRWYLNIPFAAMPDALMLGWLPTAALAGTSPHGHYAVLCTWICCCDRRPPRPGSLREAAAT